ncbi:MAG: hypothetical protein H0U13_09030 [Gemmatimonadaceae bacterium]|nr:hypothetical protein [Gemmatimonadaceae bacterium]
MFEILSARYVLEVAALEAMEKAQGAERAGDVGFAALHTATVLMLSQQLADLSRRVLDHELIKPYFMRIVDPDEIQIPNVSPMFAQLRQMLHVDLDMLNSAETTLRLMPALMDGIRRQPAMVQAWRRIAQR